MPNRLVRLRVLQEKGKCSICMDYIKGDQAELPCGHDQYCVACIWGWAQISNKCPLCVKKFFSITNKATAEISIVEDKEVESEEETFEIDVVCQICSLGNNEENLLLCDNCDKGFHTDCIGLARVPYLENWFCDNCIQTQPWDVQQEQNDEVALARQISLPAKRSRRSCRNMTNKPTNIRRSARLNH